jgi:hypothetical protein
MRPKSQPNCRPSVKKTAHNPALQQLIVPIQDQFTDLATQSKATYTKMITTPDAMDDQLMATVKSLATPNASMTKALQDLNDTISKKDFVTELGAVADSTSLQRTLT